MDSHDTPVQHCTFCHVAYIDDWLEFDNEYACPFCIPSLPEKYYTAYPELASVPFPSNLCDYHSQIDQYDQSDIVAELFAELHAAHIREHPVNPKEETEQKLVDAIIKIGKTLAGDA